MSRDAVTIYECQTDADRADAIGVRFAVFVDEQHVPAELEADEYDAGARHLLARDAGGDAVGTLRIVDKGDAAKIGRVAVVKAARGQGIGDRLMYFALALLRDSGFTLAVLEAQLPVIGFYERLGFRASGPEFEDAGILHRRMTLMLPEPEDHAESGMMLSAP